MTPFPFVFLPSWCTNPGPIRNNSANEKEITSINSQSLDLHGLVVVAGVPFHVKYLGSVLVEKSSGEDVTSDAIKTIILMVKYSFYFIL